MCMPISLVQWNQFGRVFVTRLNLDLIGIHNAYFSGANQISHPHTPWKWIKFRSANSICYYAFWTCPWRSYCPKDVVFWEGDLFWLNQPYPTWKRGMGTYTRIRSILMAYKLIWKIKPTHKGGFVILLRGLFLPIHRPHSHNHVKCTRRSS